MNFMKKILNQGDEGGQNIRPDNSQQQLALQHLNKLFDEIKVNKLAPSNGNFSAGVSVQGPSKYDIQAHEAIAIYEQKIYRLLPLFLKIFGDTYMLSPSANSGSCVNPDLLDKFVDLTTFTSMVSRLLVTEIRRRASNKTTQEASETIISFLMIPKNNFNTQSKGSSNNNGNCNNTDAKGWMLLTTLNLLVHEGGTSLIPVMAANSLPSTLVKCLYLFFDLPSEVEDEVLSQRKNSNSITNSNYESSHLPREQSFNSKNRRLLLHRVFSQFVTRICAHQSSLHELTRKDDLALLFNAITSWCTPHNILWRQTAADVILFMAKCNCVHANYLHEKSCISGSIENMSRLSELSKATDEEITDMLATIVDFISEVYHANPSTVDTLLDDYKNNLGYHFITDLVLKLEKDIQVNGDNLKKIISLTTSFIKIGTSEIKPRPLSINQLFIIPDFSPPKPNPQHSIKNLSAFTVFQNLWYKAKSNFVQELILAGLYRLYRDDGANYFILDSQNTLSQFADKLHLRNISVQEKFFAILKYIIFELKYVPCKELISISIMIKSKPSPQSTMLCLKSLLSIIKFNCVFREVFREVGLLDILTGILIEISQNICDSLSISDNDSHQLEVVLDICFSTLMGPNNQNCSVFCEGKGHKHILNLLPLTTFLLSKQIRKMCFSVIQQLVLSNSGEESISLLLGLMHTHGPGKTSPDKRISLKLDQEIALKTNILKSLVQVLRESHRCRALFRKVGGFIHVMSVLVDMEGCLADGNISSEKFPCSVSQTSQWSVVERKKIWNILKFVFLTLATAMRFEPANARFFAYEICPVNLTDSLRLLGCFTLDKVFSASNLRISMNSIDKTSNYQTIFCTPLTNIPPKQSMSCLESCCLIVRLLYDMALDLIDKTPKNHPIVANPTLQENDQKGITNGTSSDRPPSLSLPLKNTSVSLPVIIHPSIVIVIFHILPSIPSHTLQIFITETLHLLMKMERNQQALCESNLLSEILSEKFEMALVNEKHYLHTQTRYILERLAAQSISPKELKFFLRLGNPINCLPTDDSSRNRDCHKKEGGSIPLATIKTLVSMSTPKDVDEESLFQPPFVEFDMSQEGFGCLFFPSIAPVSASSNTSTASNMQQLFTNSLTGGENDSSFQSSQGNGGVIGGIGTGERSFPPQAGLTFLTWMCIDSFPAVDESHNVRLLSILRNFGAGDEFACLQLQISAKDHALLISTQETHISPDGAVFPNLDAPSKESDQFLRVWTPEMLKENRWHHIAVVLTRALLKNSTVTIYVDGHLVSNQKLHYINAFPGQSSLLGGGSNQQVHVNALIGTPPQWRKQSRLIWRQGPCHFIEEPLSANHIKLTHSLGPHYIGSFQGTDLVQSLSQTLGINQRIAEDKVVFAMSSRAMSIMTLAKMKRVYSRFDCKQISKKIGLSLHENATPIYVLHNSAGHLCGPSRSLGGILIGYIGARCFVPRPVSVTIQDIGGAALLLGLVANAQNGECLYAALKALICALRVNRDLVHEMENFNGYQTLAMILRRKKHYLNSSILHLTLNLAGTLDVYRKTRNLSSEILYPMAFKDLLCDQIELWMHIDLLKPLLEHFYELLFESNRGQKYMEVKLKNLSLLREHGLLSRLLQLLWSYPSIDSNIMDVTKNILFLLLNQTPRQNDLLYFGQYIAALLPTSSEHEKSQEQIDLRNALLKIVFQLMTSNKQAINLAIQEELVRILGFDWFLLFLHGAYFHERTVILGATNLMVLLSSSTHYAKFKEASSNGGWIRDAINNFSYRFGCQIMGFNVSSPSPTPPISSPSFAFTGTKNTSGHSKIFREEILTIPGFQHLSWLMTNHIHKSQIYFIIFQGLLGKFSPSNLYALIVEESSSMKLENLCSSLLGDGKRSLNFPTGSLVCPDLSLIILTMIHTIIWNYHERADEAVIVTQFLICLYHNWKEFQDYCLQTGEFLNLLCGTLIFEKEKGSYKLTNHKSRKHIMGFIRLIVIDSMISQPEYHKSHPNVLEMTLSAFSPCRAAQTELLKLLMSHIDSYTEVLAQQKCIGLSFNNQANSSHSQIIVNINSLSIILSDKLWQESFDSHPKEILEFQLNLVERLTTWVSSGSKNQKSLSEITPLYKSLNRAVLYHISRPIDSVPDRMSVLETLQKVHSFRQTIIASPLNNDPSFFVCLTYCLMQLIDEEKIGLTGKSRSIWHVNIDQGKDSGQQDEGALLIASVARKIWAEVYLNKKSCLEDAVKINLIMNPPNFGLTSDTPDLSLLREPLHDSLLKYWNNYIESEKIRQNRARSSSHLSLDSPTEKDPTSLITEKLGKINKVVGSGSNLVSKIVGGTTGAVSGAISTAGSSIKKEVFKSSLSCDVKDLTRVTLPVWNLLPFAEVSARTFTHVSVVNQLVDLHLKQKSQGDAHLLKYVYDDWIACENEILIREKGVWGPDYGSATLDKWKLDMTEGPHRVRKKFIKNDMFYIDYPYREELFIEKAGKKRPKYHPPMSFDSKEYYKKCKPNQGLLERDPIQDSEPSSEKSEEILRSPLRNKSQERENSFEGIRTSSLLPSKVHSTDQDESETSEFMDISSDQSCPGGEGQSEEADWAQAESQIVLRQLEDNEKISHMFRCARILGLDTYEGLLLFGKEYFYLLDGFTLLKTREIKDIDSLPSDMHDPIVPTTSSSRSDPGQKKTKKNCMKFSYEDIKEVHKRRYLLQPIALEVFSMDGRISLLVFPRKLRDKVFSRFMSVATHITDNAQDSLSGQKRNVNVESGAGLLSSLMGDTSVTQRWVRGEISNFQYLMHLNTLAGRSYNDLMQYPVFPWILADYSSSELDFSNPLTFRDLSRPMGAQTSERLEHFRRRFNEWDELNEDTPAYHYGTFYSSAMIVASYLVRTEPFTQHFLQLQGGHFDLADRMFHSVGDAYLSAAKNNVADVKELIPEFFTLPEFLLNLNNYDLGIKQNGVKLGDVLLPPWAKGDAREFIRMHRAALECDYVSSHLHEWIDLIFGYKQQGRPAIDAVNVFHHLFYEGNVDIYSIEDPLKKNATIGFINNFGQIPKQLFKKPHPAKKVANSGPPATPILPAVGLNNILISNSTFDKLVIHNLDKLRPSLHPIKELRGAVGQIIQQEKTILAVEQNKVLIPSTFSKYVAWGFADHSLRIGAYESDRAIYIYESEFLPPYGEILCGTIPSPRILITAGTSAVISVWRSKEKNRKLKLIQNLYGHSEAITCLASSASYGLIVSGSRDRTCIVWDLNRLLFVRQLGGGDESSMSHPSPIAAVAINDLTGDIATCSGNWLFFWSINGDFLASVNTLSVDTALTPKSGREIGFAASSTQILCAAFSLYNEWDADNIIMTGSSDGVVRIWSLDYVQVPIEDKEPMTWGSSSTLSETSNGSSENEVDHSHLGEPPSKDEIVRRMSLASVVGKASKDEDSSDDSLSEENKSQSVSRKSSVHKEEAKQQEIVQIKIDSGTPERRDSFNQQPSVLQMPPSRSITAELSSISKDHQSTSKQEEKIKKKPPPIEITKMRTSKSDTSLIESSMSTILKSDSILKSGNKWQRKLIFRGKLCLHNFLERKDDAEPAAITSLAMSKDSKAIFVGDARGRVYSWTISETRGFN